MAMAAITEGIRHMEAIHHMGIIRIAITRLMAIGKGESNIKKKCSVPVGALHF